MRLSHALRVKPGQSIAFVGAGGKTSAIRTLVKEFQTHTPVLVTTSTKLGLSQIDLAKEHLVVTELDRLEELQSLITGHNSVLVTGLQVRDEEKWGGLSSQVLDRLREIVLDIDAIMLIEADGARMKSIKAPDEHEPVVPDWVEQVVTMIGLDGIGKSFRSDVVHRPDIAMEILGIKGDAKIEPRHIAELLRSERGGLKGIPEWSSVRAFLRRRPDSDDLDVGEEISVEVLKSDRIQSVVLGTLHQDNPVNEVYSRVAGVILAAGTSTRLEGTKQLLPFKGKPMIKHVVEAAIAGGLDPVIVVVGEDGERIQAVLEGSSVSIVRNPEPNRGQGSSLRVGVEQIDPSLEAAVFLLADMPLVSSELIESLISRHRSALSQIVVPYSRGKRGNPVLFDRITFDALGRIEGDQGGRAIFSRYAVERVEWDDTIHFDVDTPDDLEKLSRIEG